MGVGLDESVSASVLLSFRGDKGGSGDGVAFVGWISRGCCWAKVLTGFGSESKISSTGGVVVSSTPADDPFALSFFG